MMTIIFLAGIACIATFIYLSIDIQDIVTKAPAEDKPLSENNDPQAKGHSHNGKQHEHQHQPETNKPVNTLTKQTQEISTSTATPIYGTDFDIEEHLKRPDVQKQLATAEKRFKDFMDNHPALQPQAKADMATIREYVRAEKEFHRKYQELIKESESISQELMKLTNFTLEEVKNMSEKEKAKMRDKLTANQKKRDAQRIKREQHNKTDPVYPADAYKRMKKLRQSMLANDQLHFSK